MSKEMKVFCFLITLFFTLGIGFTSYAYSDGLSERVEYLTTVNEAEYPPEVVHERLNPYIRYYKVYGVLNPIARQESVILFLTGWNFPYEKLKVYFIPSNENGQHVKQIDDLSEVSFCLAYRVLSISHEGTAFYACMPPKVNSGVYYTLVAYQYNDGRVNYFNDYRDSSQLAYYSTLERGKYIVEIMDADNELLPGL